MKIYGDGGTHPAADVIEEIKQVRELPLGRAKLLEFLKDWKTEHPID